MSDWHGKRSCILACGNVLFGDDGFGPAVARSCIRDCTIPADVCVYDAGTSVRNILFDILLSEERPSHIVIIDAMDVGREPGELFSLDLDAMPGKKTDDFSMHQIPTSNLLRELRDLCGVTITILACQVAHIPTGVSPGLSRPVSEAVPRAVELLAREHGVRRSPHAAVTR
ncbi:MAG: hydrogenase maturation protease [Gemmatimonadales bacterium]|nr:hydrogenase maturation protease [Gemmatimonadales bacterium]